MEVAQLATEEEKAAHYCELAAPLFQDVPDTAAAKPEHCIFYGYFSDDFTRFVVIKLVAGQVIFRLSNPALTQLQNSTTKLIKYLICQEIDGRPLTVSNQTRQ